MGLRIGWLTMDTAEPRKLAEFWEQALPSERVYEDDDGSEVVLKMKDGGLRLLLYRVRAPKKVKNRLHLDLIPEDQAAEVARLGSLGATRVDIGQKDVSWVVMADPEGNEFCILRAGADSDA